MFNWVRFLLGYTECSTCLVWSKKNKICQLDSLVYCDKCHWVAHEHTSIRFMNPWEEE